jgi:hypothetical protein
MVAHMFQIPRLEQTVDGRVAVTRWGRIDNTLLRVGDRLVLGAPTADSLLVLVPRGYGRPMLGRRGSVGLVAEPSGVPVSTQRWSVAGSVQAVERELERGGVGAGQRYVACRLEGGDIATLAKARALFADGPLSERDLIRLCSVAAVAPEDLNVQVAIAAASDQAAAEAILCDVPLGAIRIEMPAGLPRAEASGMVVPGPWQPRVPAAPAQLTFEDLYDLPIPQPRVAIDQFEHDDAQLSLFDQRETG